MDKNYGINLCFSGSDLILKPETPAFVKEDQTLVLTCQSNDSGGLYVFYIFDEGNKTDYAFGGGSFKQCLTYTIKLLWNVILRKGHLY